MYDQGVGANMNRHAERRTQNGTELKNNKDDDDRDDEQLERRGLNRREEHRHGAGTIDERTTNQNTTAEHQMRACVPWMARRH